jgi:hypothetical protein
MNYNCGPNYQQLIKLAHEWVDSALESSELDGNQHARWKAQGEALNIDQLADYAIAALQAGQVRLAEKS